MGPLLSVSCFMLCIIKAQGNCFLIMLQFAVRVQWVFQMDYSILLLKFVILKCLLLVFVESEGRNFWRVCSASGVSDDV